ncbi:winged helix turn helix protein [Rhizoctonia solani AG-3 Rhs1AP]|uniref:Winged helix turn helix protein n=1 Tax=Rhizoctonia solani AG-3 Rhs1AP TaxID=1086054 RepID=X8IY30_9AGAM|nr:winged helix turn helix protein [Rhizoctonia solani AG-3 Rhs1AP]
MSHKRGKELPLTRRAQIITLHNEGNSYSEIYAKTGIPPAVACKTVQHWETHGTLRSLPRSGRPHKFSAKLCRLVIRTLIRHRFESYDSIATRIGNGMTARQVRYIARKRHYRRYVARRKPFLDRRKVLVRLEWARVNRFRNWDDAIWTDKLQLGTGDKSVHPMVTRRPGEAFLPECIAPTFQSGRVAIMAWGCISHGYKGPLIRLKMQPQVLAANGRMLVVEDGALAHRGKPAKQAREELGIKQVPHPPSSPDLNPIEPL